jgi:transketolase
MKAMRDVWGETLVALGKANPNVVVLDADLANSTKADKFAKAHPDRFLQMGIAEQNCVGVAVGLASVGYVPWLSSFAIFFTHRAVDSIRMLVAQTHADVKIGGAYAGVLTGATGKTHQDVEDLAIMRAMPNMTVLAPADEVECAAAMRWATDHQGPVYLRLARDVCPDVFVAGYQFTPGKTYVLNEGTDVLLVSTGPQSVRCIEAAQLLEPQGISAGVLHVPSIKPLNVGSSLGLVSHLSW